MGRIIVEHYITRDVLRSDPNTLFVFGDNMKELGFGGQAREMRGEPNAVGIPTKWEPSNEPKAFLCDHDFPGACKQRIDDRFMRLVDHLIKGGDVVWLEAGIGTGLADLRNRAPRIWEYIEKRRAELFTLYGAALTSQQQNTTQEKT
ncbi:hypothetical protein [Tardiphaga sp.]|uniref:DUF7831 domain-containing protein n=1 Tax=Tardiphaga sp. TaxID=1926292 RepID=UPI0037D9B585